MGFILENTLDVLVAFQFLFGRLLDLFPKCLILENAAERGKLD